MIHIPFKDSEFNNIYLIDTETGKEFTKIKDIREVNITVESHTDYDLNPHEMIEQTSHTKAEMTFNMNNPMDTEEFYKMIGFDSTKMPDAYDIQLQKIVQVRKHKKRRINKKWLKRYGVRTVLVESKGWTIRNNADGTVEFIKGE